MQRLFTVRYTDNMATVIDILERLESDNSRLFKEEVLESNRSNALLREVFIAAFDPYVNYYVSKFKAPKIFRCQGDDDVVIESFLKLIGDQLSTRNLTGNAAKNAVEQFFLTLDERQAKWCTRILLKNLRCGVQETTVNKIWPGSISKFSVQLATNASAIHDPNKGIVINEKLKYPMRVEPKLDGLRCVAVKQAGSVTMYTRNGSLLETLPKIKAVLEAAPYDDIVLDGEAMGEDWSESASILMSHKSRKDDDNIVYHVFDAIPLADWIDQESSEDLPFSVRIDIVADVVASLGENAPVKQVIGKDVNSDTELLSFYAEVMNRGYEGIMLKDLDSPYIFKRGDHIKKLKPVTTFEGTIVGHYVGRRGTKREGVFSGFEVLLSNGVVTRVGSGFNDKFRAEVQVSGPDSYIGKIVELEGQPDPLTKDGLTEDGKVRFPVYARLRDGADVDPMITEVYEKYRENK